MNNFENIKYETQQCSELEDTKLINIVKTESSNVVKIKSEQEWPWPTDSVQAGRIIEPNLSIVKSEYEFQSPFLYWTIDEVCDSDEQEEDEADGEAEGDNIDDDNMDNGDSYNDDKKPIIYEPINPDDHIITRKTVKDKKTERYFYFQKKRNFFEPYLLRACPYCGIEFESVKAWDTHLNDMHNFKALKRTLFTSLDDGKMSCNECKTILSNSPITLKPHILIHLPYTNIFKCKLCSYARSKHLLMLSHIERKHFDVVGEALSALMETKTFKNCAYCGKYVGISNMLTTHIQVEHSEIYEHKLCYVCPYCGEQFTEEKSHKEHVENIHKFKSLEGLSFETINEQENNVSQMKYRCLKCQALFGCRSHSSGMIVHALAHLPYKCFKCRYCEYDNISKSKVVKHTCKALLLDIKNNPKQATKTTPQLKQRRVRKFDVINKIHVCPKCGENFEQQALWQAHLIEVHSFDKYESLNIETTTSTDGKSEITSCTICKKIFAKPNSFFIKQHAFTHMPYKIYKCKLCQAAMNSLFVCYCMDKSEKEKLPPITYMCPKCGKEFSKEYNWRKHIITVHDLCEPNGLNFDKISDTEAPSYKCSDCEAIIQESSPASTDLLFQHATIEHMSFKCYKCGFCGEQSYSKNSMIEHCKNCYNQTKLNITEDKEVDKKTKAKVIPNRKRKLSTDFVVEKKIVKKEMKNQERKIIKPSDSKKEDCNDQTDLSINADNDVDKKGTNKSRRKILQKKPTILEAQSDPLDTNNGQKFTQTSMGICSEKTVALNKYNKYITYACPECNIPLATAEAWHAHISSEHDFFAENRLNISPIPDIGCKGICNECSGMVHGSILHWQRHKLTHMPYQAFICNICIHRAKTLNVLFDHIQRRHLTLGKFECIFCDVIFSTFYDRFEHIKSQHSDVELENVCKICSKRYESKYFMEHMRTHDYNRILNECGYCERKYTSVEERRRHWKRCHRAEWESDHFREKTHKPLLPKINKKTKEKKCKEETEKVRHKNREHKHVEHSSDCSLDSNSYLNRNFTTK